MKIYYCWRCRQNMPFLEESEWTQVAPYLIQDLKAVKQYRKENNADLKTARANVPCKPAEIFKQITGYAGIHPNAIIHHRLSSWGQPCNHCGYLLRTPKTSICVHCDHKAHQQLEN